MDINFEIALENSLITTKNVLHQVISIAFVRKTVKLIVDYITKKGEMTKMQQ